MDLLVVWGILAIIAVVAGILIWKYWPIELVKLEDITSNVAIKIEKPVVTAFKDVEKIISNISMKSKPTVTTVIKDVELIVSNIVIKAEQAEEIIVIDAKKDFSNLRSGNTKIYHGEGVHPGNGQT
jgi:hypothetical protein